MLNKKGILLFISFVMVLSIISGVITYRMVGKEGSEKPVVESSSQKDEKAKILPQEENDESKDLDFAINDVFNGVDNLYIRSQVKTSSSLEINGKDKGIIIANFKALQKQSANEAELENQILDLEVYAYQIDIVPKNLKIIFYDETQYMVIEKIGDTEDENQIYKLEKEEHEDFISLLDDTYINKIIEKILYPIPEKMYINAEDENALYVMNKKEIKYLMSNIKILSIEDQQEYIGIPNVYPNYNISFKRDAEYTFYIKNNELMIIDTPIVYLYCKYDKVLWDFIVDKLPKENTALENDLRFLLKSERVIVKDLAGVYDLQNDSYYNIELPRQILRSEPKQIGKASNVEINDELRFALKFLVDGQSKEVLIYSNHIVYDDELYYSKNIYEHISSTLMMP